MFGISVIIGFKNFSLDDLRYSFWLRQIADYQLLLLTKSGLVTLNSLCVFGFSPQYLSGQIVSRGHTI